MLQLAPSFQRFGHRDFVRVFNVAAGRNPCRDARHPERRVLQHSLDVYRGGLAFHRWIGCNDQFIYLATFDTLTQTCEPQMLRSDAMQRRERSVQHVIDAVVAASLFNRGDVGRLLDNAYQALIACGAAAIYAGINVRDVAANRAQMKTGLDLTDRLGKQIGVFVAGAQDVKGEPLRRLAANARQLLQFIDEPRHRFGEFGQGTSTVFAMEVSRRTALKQSRQIHSTKHASQIGLHHAIHLAPGFVHCSGDQVLQHLHIA